MFRNRRGFSLLEVIIIGGLISGLSLVVMQLTRNTASTQVDAFNNADYFSLRSEVENILTNSNDCIASFNTVTFSGSTIKDTPINVEIWRGDQAGARSRKFISGTDAAFKNYGKLNIEEIKFSMPDYTWIEIKIEFNKKFCRYKKNRKCFF
jgi:hypothetical protein